MHHPLICLVWADLLLYPFFSASSIIVAKICQIIMWKLLLFDKFLIHYTLK